MACIISYTHGKNAQVATDLQTSCNKSVHKLFTRCIRTACPEIVGTSLEQAVDKLYDLDGTIRPVTRLFQQD